jgi:pimeloyl-ACP methyl ester carboxylesterase
MTMEIGGLPLYYEDAGEGKPLLLLHGWGGKCDSFLPLARDFRTLRRVIALDFPGHGATPEPPEPWSVTEYMEMTRAFMDKLGLNGCDIVAHSFGGRVALLLAATYPEKVGRMLLTGCAGLLPQKTAKRRMRSCLYRAARTLADNGITRLLMGEKKVGEMRERLIAKFGSEDYKALSPSMRRTFNRIVAQDLAPCLPGIKAETLLIWGENDGATPLWMGRKMEKDIPGAALIVMKDAGHFAYLERYSEFRAIAYKYFVG